MVRNPSSPIAMHQSRLPLVALSLSLILDCTATAQQPAAQQTPRVDAAHFDGLRFRCVGPSRGGRATTVTGVPQQPGTFYMGATGGGVWKTTDFGNSWRNVSDGYFASPSIGAIRVAPSDPEIIYCGTGSDGLRSNVIPGRGIYRSDDAGATWRFIGLRDSGHIGAVEIHPNDPDTAYVAVIGNAFKATKERGLYKTVDGGKTWDQVLHISDKEGIVDLELHPADPETIYACSWFAERKPWTIISGTEGSGLYRSKDAGKTWHKLSKGLPDGVVGKSDLAVSRAAPDRVYALIEAPVGKGGVYRSDDGGDSFRLVSTQRGLLDRPFYYCNIDADPNDADRLYVNSTRFYRSDNAGRRWRTMRTPHGDNHDIWIHPDNSRLMVQCNDGGANVSLDGGRSWSTQSNQPTAELYQVNVDDQLFYWLYAGQQDNSTIRVPGQPPHGHAAGPRGFWQAVGGCETGPVVPKPGDPNIVYANCKGRFGRFNLATGQEKQFYVGAANMYGHNPKDLLFRFQRVAPILVSPHDPRTVYHASQYLHRSRDEGQSWEIISPDLTAFTPDTQVISGSPITRDITGEEFYSTIYAVAESPLQKGLIWCGANDGPIHVTTDGGENWNKVTPEGLPPGGRVQTLEPSPHDAKTCYAAVLRYQLGDDRPHIYRTRDLGKTWTRITAGIPADFPSRVVRADPAREGLLYAGTEFGLFVSFDDGGQWQAMQRNLPVTPITDMKVHAGDLVLSTMGRSFWILDDLSRIQQLGRSQLGELHVFTPRDSLRMRLPGVRGSAGVSYLSTGIYIDYWLAKAQPGLRLEILDAEGKVLRSIRARRRPPRRTPSRGRGLATSMPAARRRVRPGLSAAAGAHRYRWDLRRDGVTSGRGPMVLPGEYRVRIRAGSLSATASFKLKMDPRLERDGVSEADLSAQQQLIDQVAQLSSDASQLARDLREALRNKPEDKSLSERLAQLETARGRYRQPMLRDQIRYLASMIDRADQRPGRDAVQRYEELSAWLERLRKR